MESRSYVPSQLAEGRFKPVKQNSEEELSPWSPFSAFFPASFKVLGQGFPRLWEEAWKIEAEKILGYGNKLQNVPMSWCLLNFISVVRAYRNRCLLLC